MTGIPNQKTMEQIKNNRRNSNTLDRVMRGTRNDQLTILGQNFADEMDELMDQRNKLEAAIANVVEANPEEEQVAAEVNVPEEQVAAEVNILLAPGSPNFLENLEDLSEGENQEAEAGANQEAAGGANQEAEAGLNQEAAGRAIQKEVYCVSFVRGALVDYESDTDGV